MESETKKPYIKLLGKPILAHTLESFEASYAIAEIVLVVAAEDIEACEEEVIKPYGLKKVSKIVHGGYTRQESVFNGLLSSSLESDLVVIHDGARPFIDHDLLSACIEAAAEFAAAIPAVPLKDTIKEVDKDGFVVQTLDRSCLCLTQTPQAFKRDLIIEAHQWAKKFNVFGTDDASLVEAFGHKVTTVMGNYNNLKITTPEDLILAKAILKAKGKEQRAK
jgi:2-C-methyl-D-erythritol 4-phosphate cytidylyltransferase